MRQAADIEMALKPRPDGIPLQQWLYDEIRTAILSGRLMPGSRLPATRDLAIRLKISRGTVLAVYAQLGAEGYIQGATGKGSFVAPELPDLPPRPVATGSGVAEPISRNTTVTKYEAPAVVLSTRGKKLSMTQFSVTGRTFPAKAFRTNQPDVTAFPFDLWTRIASSRSRRCAPNTSWMGTPAVTNRYVRRSLVTCVPAVGSPALLNRWRWSQRPTDT